MASRFDIIHYFMFVRLEFSVAPVKDMMGGAMHSYGILYSGFPSPDTNQIFRSSDIVVTN